MDEEKVANSIAMSIEPLLIPTIQFYTWRGREVLNIVNFFPDAVIRLGRFAGRDKSEIIDSQTLSVPISLALDQILLFIRRHTAVGAQILSLRRKDIPEYSEIVLREAVANALLHADYSIKGVHINIAIFSDRIEITNPGGLPLGLNMEAALSGVSQLRNRVIGRVSKELNIIEQWGFGLGRMIKICKEEKIIPPRFEELANFFRVTLYSGSSKPSVLKDWEKIIIHYLKNNSDISAKHAQKLWGITSRSTSVRLKNMVKKGLLVEIATDQFDPQKTFRLGESSLEIINV